MRVHFLLLSGGSGSRMNSELPKQFLLLHGRPILLHSLVGFLRWRNEQKEPERGSIVVVAHPDHMERTREILGESGFLEQIHSLVPGGSSRHGSTLAGIEAMLPVTEPDDLLYIHDAARPRIEACELDRLRISLSSDSACLAASLAAPLTETILRGEGLPGYAAERLDRSELFAMKTPQAIRVSALEKLLHLPEESGFTDLLSWCEAGAIRGKLVESGPWNWKVTTPSDLALMEALPDGFA